MVRFCWIDFGRGFAGLNFVTGGFVWLCIMRGRGVLRVACYMFGFGGFGGWAGLPGLLFGV